MAFERKFKDGDKVKVIKKNDAYFGRMGTIYNYHSPYNGKPYYSVQFSTTTTRYTYNSNELEKVTEEISSSQYISEENIKLPLKEGQIVTLLDGKKYEVVKTLTLKRHCEFCSLNAKNNQDHATKCNLCHIKGASFCNQVIHSDNHFKLLSEPLSSVSQNTSILNIITKEQAEKAINFKSVDELKVGMQVYVDPRDNGIPKYRGKLVTVQSFDEQYVCFKEFYGSWSPNRFCYFPDMIDSSKQSEKLHTLSDFKPGMKVKIKEEFDRIPCKYNPSIIPSMLKFKGQIRTVDRIFGKAVCVEGWSWAPEWLEIVNECDQKVSISSDEESIVTVEIKPKEKGVVTKVKFTLTDFKFESIGRSKRTIL